MKIRILQFIVVLILFTSCKTPELLPGYILNSAPNVSDRPGRVYRLDNTNKTDILVEYLPVTAIAENIFIPEKSTKKSVNVNTLVKFISKSSDVSANSEIGIDQKSDFEFRLKDTKVLKVSDAELRPMYANLLSQLKSDMVLFGLKEPRYFIVREAVTAKEIFITTSNDLNNKAEFLAKINSLIEGKSKVQWTSNRRTELKIILDEGVFVFYKPEQIVLRPSSAGDTSIGLKEPSKQDLEMLQIK